MNKYENRCLTLNNTKAGKLIALVAPSGSGKTTIANKLIDALSDIQFSVSATTRPRRNNEQEGRDYYFLSEDKFNQLIADNDFLEWEEVYDGTRYGTLRSEVDKMVKNGYYPLLDIEVNGAANVKTIYGSQCVTIFIHPPSIKELKQRLINRGSETDHSLQERVNRAKKELTYVDTFDYVVVNDDLDTAFNQVKTIVKSFIAHK